MTMLKSNQVNTVNADAIDWSVNTADIPLDQTKYGKDPEIKLNNANPGHTKSDFKIGKYKENGDPRYRVDGTGLWNKDIYEKSCHFMISLDAQNNELITKGNEVAAPCPPFCQQG